MPVTSRRISQEEPVLFRVNAFEPSPLPAPLSQPGQWILSIHRADNPEKLNFQFWPHEFETHREAIEEAIRTQDVYWVDWNYDNTVFNPGVPIDSTDRRLLRAISARQIVPVDEMPTESLQ